MTAPNTSSPDLDAIEARAQRTVERTERYLDAVGKGGDPDEIDDAIREQGGARDTLALVARVRRLEALRDDLADAFDVLVLKVWRATGETHEPCVDVAALLAKVAGQREALEGYRLAAVDVVERIDGERQEPDFDMPAEFGAYVCDEVDHLRAAVAAEAHAREAAVAARASVERAVCEAAGEVLDPRHDAADVVRRAVAAARREGAATMREECVQAAVRVADAWARCECRCVCSSSLAGLAAAEACAAGIRALPIVEAP